MIIVEPPENYRKPPQPPAMPPELQKAKERMEKGRQSRDVIRALADLAAEARGHRDELQQQTGRQSRGAVKRTQEYIAELVAKYQKAYSQPLEDPELRDLFDEAVQDINEMELRRAAVFETAQARAERDEVLALDLARRLAEVRENPNRLEESIYDRKTCLALQLQGEEYKARLKKDESTLVAAAVNARLDRNDVGGAEFDLLEFRDRLAVEEREMAYLAFNKKILELLRLTPFEDRLASIEKVMVAARGDREDTGDAAMRLAQARDLLARDFERYRSNPVFYLIQTIGARLNAWAEAGWLDPNDEPAVYGAMVSVALDLQARISSLPPRLMTNKMAADMRQEFLEAAPDKKIDMVRLWKNRYGRHFGLALREVQLPQGAGYDMAVNMVLANDEPSLTLRLMEAADMKTPELEKPAHEELRTIVMARLDQTAYGRVLAGVSRLMPNDAGATGHRRGARALAFKLALKAMEDGLGREEAAGQAVETLTRLFTSVAVDGLAYVIAPGGMNKALLEKGLVRLRDLITGGMEHRQDAVTATKAIWINLGLGGIGLVLPDGEHLGLAASEDGTPIIHQPGDALALAEAEAIQESGMGKLADSPPQNPESTSAQ